MQSRRAFLSQALGAAVLISAAAACGSSGSRSGSSSAGSGPNSGAAITGATAITEVFGDGQKLSAVALQYPKPIDTSKLTTSSFTVANRTVTRVYANTSPATATQGLDGQYVIVELSTNDSDAALWMTGQPQGPPSGVSASTTKTSAATTPPGGPPRAGHAGPPPTIKPATATVTQTQAVAADDGTTYPASTAPVTTSKVSNLIVDDFQQYTFNDTATGQTLNYNLYIPRNYDKSKSYPLVLFMPDASAVSTQTQAALVQGLGAVCWASPRDQAKRESFVVAPVYPTVVVDDDYKPTTLFDATVNLLNELPKRYSIDTNRLYATGQSMGAMMTLGMNIKHPDLFAASFVVAGQWPATEATPLARKKLWIVVSQGDDKAYPGENAIMDVIGKQSTKISRATWDGKSTAAEFATDVHTLEAQGSPVNYASFVKGSVLPVGASPGASEHMSTWRVAYSIDGIRDWIFQQRR